MWLKLLADSLFPVPVVEALARAGYDAVHASEVGATDLPLRELVRLAVFENRILLTENRSLARLVEAEPAKRPSVIFIGSLEGGVEARSHVLLNLLALFDEDLAQGAMVIVREGQTLLRKFTRPQD